jgi:hypothetical protein
MHLMSPGYFTFLEEETNYENYEIFSTSRTEF